MAQDRSSPPALTETMISAIVWLDILWSPNTLMLKALIFSAVATCSRRAATSSDSTTFEAAILRAEGQGWAQLPWLGGGFGTDEEGDQGIPAGRTGFTGRRPFSREPPGPRNGEPPAGQPPGSSLGLLSPCPCFTRGLILPGCPSWREARPPVKPERIIRWQRSKCHFTVTQSSHFLIHRAQPGHLSWPGVGGSGQGHQEPMACASSTPPLVYAGDPKDPTAAVLGQSKGWIPPGTPPHLLPCLEHPHLGYPAPPVPLPHPHPGWSPPEPSTEAARWLPPTGNGIWEVFPMALSSPG